MIAYWKRRQILEPDGLTLHFTGHRTLAKLLKPHYASLSSCVKWGLQKYLAHKVLKYIWADTCKVLKTVLGVGRSNPPISMSITAPSFRRGQEFEALLLLTGDALQDCVYSKHLCDEVLSPSGTQITLDCRSPKTASSSSPVFLAYNATNGRCRHPYGLRLHPPRGTWGTSENDANMVLVLLALL